MNKIGKCIVLLVIGILVVGCAITPKPLTKEDMLKRMATDLGDMHKDQQPISGPISMEEAMARAIKYNLDHRIKLMEDALALRQVDILTFDMLPRVVASAGYVSRDSYNASSSMNVYTEEQSLATSTSQDKAHTNADLTLTWNILDFGMSYFQAKQQADRSLIMKERRRKVVHNIMQQIRQAYWLALGAQQLEGKFATLLQNVDKGLQDLDNIDNEKLRSPIDTLTYRKTLLEIIKQLEAFRDELAQAKPRLAALMNIPPGQNYLLIIPSKMDIPQIPETLESMENKVLLQRPELIEADYNERISLYETKKMIVRMLPGIELGLGGHYDSNSFLFKSNWLEGSARITWNLLNLLSAPLQYDITKNQTWIVQAQRLALSMAVLTQVHVSYQDFFNRKRQYQLAAQLQEIDAQIYEKTMNQKASGAQNNLNEIRAGTAALMAEYRRYQNYAALQTAYGQMITTLGIDPLPETITDRDLITLTKAIRSSSWKSIYPTSLEKTTISLQDAQIVIPAGTAPAAKTKSVTAPVTQQKPAPAQQPAKTMDNQPTAPATGTVTAPVVQQKPAPEQQTMKETANTTTAVKTEPIVTPVIQQKPAPKQQLLKVIANRDSKLYHLPGMRYYDKVFKYHRTEFNSEEEAIKVGYRKAPR